ncbi:MAG: class I SAM-dependent methyltransferase [Acidimicrobiales bacterium]
MAGYDELAAYAVRALNPERKAAVERHAGRVTVDVGCGNGSYVLQLGNDGRRLFGADGHRFEAWNVAPERFLMSDAARLPLAPASVDTLLCFETLEHLPEPEGALREYRRVTRGRLVLTVPNCDVSEGMRRSNLTFGHYVDRTHRNFYELQSVSAAVEAAGFRVIEAGYINRIDVFAFLGEALRLPAPAVRVLRKLLRPVVRPYPMTCLVVGEAA